MLSYFISLHYIVLYPITISTIKHFLGSCVDRDFFSLSQISNYSQQFAGHLHKRLCAF